MFKDITIALGDSGKKIENIKLLNDYTVQYNLIVDDNCKIETETKLQKLRNCSYISEDNYMVVFSNFGINVVTRAEQKTVIKTSDIELYQYICEKLNLYPEFEPRGEGIYSNMYLYVPTLILSELSNTVDDIKSFTSFIN